ncbi:hypothetical protein AO718_18485 [Aeromonas veronii]|nr:hypothetical protein AO718_18485 [Aeromonas veronii]KRW03856.1 hypothetical protein AO725_10675 [Aeromonas veronii]KRW11317.1 hypothetical protein AO745_15055 [Aeromonas veronii]KRW14312.1 hypothetical protein AO732_16380 [Aeromonas veronii]KRW18237.1 hypothetical protein AO722_19705 [Aeromonas veronii]
MDLGGVQMSYQHLVTPSGGPKSGLDVWDHLRMDLGAVLKGGVPFRTTSRRTSGVAKREFVFWLPLQTDLGGGAFSQIGILSPLRTDLGLC